MLTFSPSFYYRDRLGQQNSLQQLNWKTMDTGITFLRYRQWHLLPSSSPPGLSTLVNQPRNNTVTPKWPAWYLHQCTEGENDKNQLKANWQHQNQKHSVSTNKSNRKYCQYIWCTNEDTKTRKKKSQQFLRCKDQCWGAARALSRASAPSSEYLTPTWSQYSFMGLKLG